MYYLSELVATILTNWCGTWFEFFPNPPINILCMIENLIAHADPELYQHFVQYNITTEIYAWPLLQTGLSEVFTQDEWLCLWDSLICHPPGPLLMVHNPDTFELLASSPSEVHPDRLLSSLIQSDSKDNQENICPSFQPLTSPHYPIITRYPKFIVNYHIQERERIREEEKEYLRQKATVEDMQRRAQLMANEEHNWYRQQQLLLDAEDRRRMLLAEEENKLREQRKRLNALIREVKLHELSLAEESRCHFRKLDIRRRQCELNKLEQELTRLTNCRVDEMDAAAYAAELADLRERLNQRRAENLATMNEQLHFQNDKDLMSNNGFPFLRCHSDINGSVPPDRDHEKRVDEDHPDNLNYGKTSAFDGNLVTNFDSNDSYNKVSRLNSTKIFPFTSTKLDPGSIKQSL
ncbi:unnamed protein product [Heterobilharzia americana]|nr:unnamed protein product [Heterobilharzia americana]